MTLAEDSPLFSGSTIVAENDEGQVKVRCNKCNKTYVLSDHILAGSYIDRWMCQCKNILGVDNDGEIRQAAEYLTVPEARTGEFLPVGDDGYTVIREDSDELTPANVAVWLVNRAAKHEDFGQGGFDFEFMDAYLILDGINTIGCLTWGPSSNGRMVLRQLFITESYRRQGIGGAIIEYWWENVAKEWCEDKEEDFYHVEGPNDDMRYLLMSINHGGDTEGYPNAYEYTVM